MPSQCLNEQEEKVIDVEYPKVCNTEAFRGPDWSIFFRQGKSQSEGKWLATSMPSGLVAGPHFIIGNDGC